MFRSSLSGERGRNPASTRTYTCVIDLGPKEACTGLTFVCLNRAKRLVDLMVEPMSFDRIGNLGNSSTMKARLQEEVRLVEIAQGTRVRYTNVPPVDAHV